MGKTSSAPKNTNNKRQRKSAKQPPQTRTRRHLLPSHLIELWKIWKDDPRVPTIASRRAWAVSRNAKTDLVDGWFLRRRAHAKRRGELISDETYELSVEQPVSPEPVIKTEPSSPLHIDTEPYTDVPSDDTVACSDSQMDPLGQVGVSPDTVCDIESAADGPSIPDCCCEALENYTQAKNESLNDEKSGATLVQESSPDLDPPCGDVEEIVQDTHGTKPTDPSQLLCNQGGAVTSTEFTCVLCSSTPLEASLYETYKTAKLSRTDDQSFVGPIVSRLEVSSDTLMELSAIPFLFCTPALSHRPSFDYQNHACDWMIIEDELTLLVTQGKLDFSSLNALDFPVLDTPDAS